MILFWILALILVYSDAVVLNFGALNLRLRDFVVLGFAHLTRIRQIWNLVGKFAAGLDKFRLLKFAPLE